MQLPFHWVTAIPSSTDQSFQLPDKPLQLATPGALQDLRAEPSCDTHTADWLTKLGLYSLGTNSRAFRCGEGYFPQQDHADVGAVLLAWGGGGCPFCGRSKSTLMRPKQRSSGAGDFLLAWWVMRSSGCKPLNFTLLMKIAWWKIFSVCAPSTGVLLLRSRDPPPSIWDRSSIWAH